MAAAEPAPRFAVPAARGLKVRAWRYHRSQIDYAWRNIHVPPWLVYLLFDQEHYAVSPVQP